MGLFTGSLLACDIDNTLMHNGVIHPRNIDQIAFFMREGGMFSMATGRTVSAVSPVLEQLKQVSPSVMANGGMIYDFERRVVLYEAFIDERDRAIAQKVLGMGRKIGIEVHSGADVMTLYRTAETDDHQAYERLPTNEVSYEQAITRPWNKVVYLLNNEQDRAAVKAMLEHEQTFSSFCDTSTIIDGRARFYYEQFPKNISKAATLARLCKMYGISKGKFFAIGDYDNDLEMLKSADISAAPANACEAVKSVVDLTLGRCECGAVADFIEYLSRKDG